MRNKIMSSCLSLFAFVGAYSMSLRCPGWFYEPKKPEGLEELI